MSKKIVIDKEDWDKFLENISTNKRFILNITEIDTDQSISERAERHYNEPYDVNGIDITHAYRQGYEHGATEQDLISKAREKEKKCVHPYNRVYIDKKERYCVLCGKDLTTI